MTDAQPQRRFQFSFRKLMLWMAVVALFLILFGHWTGIYVAVRVAACLASILFIRLKYGLWPAYLAAVPITAIGFYCVLARVGAPPQDFRESVIELVAYSACGTIGALLPLGVVCLVQFAVNLVDALIGCRRSIPTDSRGNLQWTVMENALSGI